MIDFPTLRGRGIISVDVETCDPHLRTLGPGWVRGRESFIAGVAIGTADGFREYYPVAHESGDNLPKAKVFAWLSEELSDETPKVFANATYDLGFLTAAGVKVGGPHYDIQVAEYLIDENQRDNSLEALARRYLGEGKVEDKMSAYLLEAFGRRTKAGELTKTGNANLKGYIWRAPPEIVREYAIGDVDLPIRIFEKQREQLDRQDLWEVFRVETLLIPILVEMRRRGVVVDVARATQLVEEYAERSRELYKLLPGVESVWAAAQIAPLFPDAPRTLKTNAPSLTAAFLEAHPSSEAKAIVEIRRLEKLSSTFLQGYIIEGNYRGKIHCNFNQRGAETGRFSSSNPNLQNIPARSADGKILRELFLPNEGSRFFSADYSQQELRLIVHDAVRLGLSGAEELAARFKADPKTDFHQVVAELTGLKRSDAKTITFGLAYGMGERKLAASLGVTDLEAQKILSTYHEKAPFLKPLSRTNTNDANTQGWVQTILGRRRHFNQWEINGVISSERELGSKRAFTHKALNSRIQGSGADVMKKALVDLFLSGVAAVARVSLTIHDEVCGSVANTREGDEALKELERIMATTIPLNVPLLVEAKTGANWGECK